MSGLRLTSAEPVEVVYGSRYDYGMFDEGYEWIEKTRRHIGHRVVSSWGLDGWDLGDWPLVILSASDDGLTVCEYVEGDLVFRTYASRGDASGFLDSCLFLWTGYAVDALTVELAGRRLPGRVDDLPDRFRGPFSWHRLAVSKGEPCRPGCRRCEISAEARLSQAGRLRAEGVTS